MMDLKSELRESVAESKEAKATQNAWVLNARLDAEKHNKRILMWLFLIVLMVLAIAGMFIAKLAFVTSFVSSIYGWIGLESYTLIISAALIVLGAVRIWTHIKKRNEQTLFANQIAAMPLTKFRHSYM